MHEKEAPEANVGMIQGDKAFEVFAKTRSIVIAGEINQKLAEKTMQQLLFLQEISDEPIKVFINSQGGHVESGDTIHDMLKFVKPRIIMIGTGWVASAGITIYLAAAKNDRYTLPNTRFLIHQPSGGAYGQAVDIKIEAEEIIKMRERVNRIISTETGQSYEKVAKDTDRNFWMSPIEAKEYGIVGKLINSFDEIK